MKAITVTDVLLNYLYTDSSLRERLTDQVASVAGLELDLPETELTTAEVDNIRTHHLLLKLIAALNQKSKTSDSGPVEAIVSQVEFWLKDKFATLSSSSPTGLPGTINLTLDTSSIPLHIPSWLYLHVNISLLETLKAISLFISSQAQAKSKSKSTSIPKEKLESLKSLTKDLTDVIKRNTRMLKDQIAGSGILGELVSTVITGPKGGMISFSTEIEQMTDMASVELFCGSLMESWDEALDGVYACAG